MENTGEIFFICSHFCWPTEKINIAVVNYIFKNTGESIIKFAKIGNN